jgi:phosphoesterase RecJ-like protein
MKDRANFEECVSVLKRSVAPLVLSHYNPDGDALGSSLALYLGLKGLGKKASIINESVIPDRYHFMPSSSEIKNSVVGLEYDLVVACDCGDRKRLGDKLGPTLSSDVPLVNIDHHASNTLFGAKNWVEGEASSTSEMIFEVLTALGAEFSHPIAMNLLTGLVTDTGSFRYSSTSPRTLEIASKLVGIGASPDLIAKNVFESRKRSAVQLAATTVSNIEFILNDKVSILTVTQDMLKKFDATLDDTEGLVEEGRAIKGVLVSVLLKQDVDMWHISLRSSSPAVDVSKVAATFGGGGHKAAAGFRWRKEGSLLKSALFEELSKIIK